MLTPFGDGYPSVAAFVVSDGEQRSDPIAVCVDMELHVDEERGNPSVFCHVELIYGAIRSQLSSSFHESKFES